jgi:hypothetical protein
MAKKPSTPNAPAQEEAPVESIGVYKKILALRAEAAEIQKDGKELTEAESDALEEIERRLSKLTTLQEKRAKKQFALKGGELELQKIYTEQAAGIASISKVYKGLTTVQAQSLKTVETSLSSVQSSLLADENKKAILESTLSGISEMQALQQKIAELGPEDVEAQASINAAYNLQQSKILENIKLRLSLGEITEEEAAALTAALKTQEDSLAAAQKYGTINAETKEIIEGQIQAYEGIKKSIRGVIGTAKLLFSGWQGFARVTLMGAGAAITKLSKTTKEFGGYLGTATLSATVLGTVFDDAGDVAKGLADELGGMEKATFGAQLNTNLMAINMGISGAEAAKLTGNFARMNGGSVETAQNLAAGTKEMAKTAGVVPSKVMADLAGSAEEFALYGKDGGKNLAQAAVQAAKMGVSLKTMTGVADNLLDFENSINSELELGAMLGKDINLDRARALAYEGDIAGATQETLNALGGVEAFNQMDYFQKKKTAELMGVSVEELQKMVTAQEEAATIGGQISGAFNTVTEGITATLGPIGNMVSGLSGAIGTTQEIAGNFKSAGGFLKDMGGKIKGMFGGAKPPVPSLPGTPPIPGKPSLPTTPAAASTPAAGGDPAGKADKFGKIKMGDVLKAAVALLILAAALFVFAKAANAFGDDINWRNVFIGIGAITLLGLVAAGLAAIGGPLLVGAGAMLIASVAFLVFGIAAQQVAIGIGMFGDALKKVDVGQMVMFGLGLIPLGLGMATFGLLSPLIILGAIAMTALGIGLLVLGAGLLVVGNGISALSSGMPTIVEQISALSTINFLPILGLAGALTILSIALAAVALSGMMALPALLALGLIAGGAAAVMGGGEGEGGDRTGELIDEIKGLRADLIAGKIAVNIDGQKVTSNVGKVVSRISSNSYAKV